MKPEQSLILSSESSEPPSNVIFDAFKAKTANNVEELAQKVLLPTEEVKLWLEHLETVAANRKRGAEKGALTRHQKAAKERGRVESSELYACGVCNGTYQEETEEIENWIGCDKCEMWFHWACVNICDRI